MSNRKTRKDIRRFVSGAEALAHMLRREKITHVFAYPGTSELATCEAISKMGSTRIVNGRGDKETAFMAAGGNLLSPSNAVAILHGARGLTNATGAIADALRNEIGTLFIVGLPSTSSAKFLPPHGERNLVQSVGNFTKYYDEVTEVADAKDTPIEQKRKARAYIEKMRKAFRESRSLPGGSVLIGVPQDAAEKRWIPRNLLHAYSPLPQNVATPRKGDTEKANAIARKAKNPFILVDDFLYKNPRAKRELISFARRMRAPVFQMFYGRGPMLFERSSARHNPYCIGPYLPHDSAMRALLQKADLLITLEDRNMYERVVGVLPPCPKIALTSNPDMTRKNNYLKKSDILLAGNVVANMQTLGDGVKKSRTVTASEFRRTCEEMRDAFAQVRYANPKYRTIRTDLPNTLGNSLCGVSRPILVDDSQMFGGLLATQYDSLPENVRVFGDHGAFIGGGLALAAGLAICDPTVSVMCTLGDQSFTNAIQGLVAVVQEQVPVIYIVCNNGKSVSLLKQIHSQDFSAFAGSRSSFLENAPISYADIAKTIGVASSVIDFTRATKSRSLDPTYHLRQELRRALRTRKPALIELRLPSNLEAWSGIWLVQGNEQGR